MVAIDKPDPAPAVGALVGFAVALVVSLAFPSTSYFPLLLLMLPGRLTRLWRRARSGRARSADVGE